MWNTPSIMLKAVRKFSTGRIVRVPFARTAPAPKEIMSDAEFNLLETIYSTQEDNATLSQRELAGKAGLSLGMTNVLLRRFVERGWVKLSHLSRRSLGYILTPQGLDEILRRSLAYFSRAAKSASLYRGRIEAFVGALSARNFSTLVLEGPAELDFLFEYSCERHGLEFVKNPKAKRRSLLASQNSTMFVFSHLLDDATSPSLPAAVFAAEPPLHSVTLAHIIFPCPS